MVVSGLWTVRRRQRPEQSLRRACGARLPHPPRDRARARPHARGRRGLRHPRRAALGRIPEDEHPGRHLLPERGASLPSPEPRQESENAHRGELRRAHAQHHWRADADQFRRAESRRRARERHAGMGPRRFRARARRLTQVPGRNRPGRPARAAGVRQKAHGAARDQECLGRRGACVAPGNGPHHLPLRRAHAGGICRRFHPRLSPRARRPVDPGNRSMGGRAQRARRADRRRRRRPCPGRGELAETAGIRRLRSGWRRDV